MSSTPNSNNNTIIMASRPTTPLISLTPTTPMARRALSPPSKPPKQTPPLSSPIPLLAWRNHITWDHLNPHLAPITRAFDENDDDAKTLVPQTPANRIILLDEHYEILRERRQARFGGRYLYWIVNDDFNPKLHGNNLPATHMILLVGDPKQTGGQLWFDGMAVKQKMVVEKREGIWGAYEVDADQASDSEEQLAIEEEEQIYQVFLEGAEGDEEEAWEMYEAFREHQEKRAYEEEQIYQVFLEGAEGDEEEAWEMYEAFREHQKQRAEEKRGQEEQQEEEELEPEHEPEHEPEREAELAVHACLSQRSNAIDERAEIQDSSVENTPVMTTTSGAGEPHDDLIDFSEEPDVYACLDEWATRFDLSEGNLDNNPSTIDLSQLSDDLIDFKHPDVYACLDEWAMRFDLSEGNLDNNQSLEEEVVSITTLCKGDEQLIDIQEEPDVYECLGKWASRYEERVKANSSLIQVVKPVSKRDGELIEITTETTDAYQCLGLWAKQFEDNAGDDAPPKDFPSETTTTAASDIFYDGDNARDDTPLKDFSSETTGTAASDIFYDSDNKATDITAATTPEQENDTHLATPLRLKTPEDFSKYHDIPRLWFHEQCQEIENHGRSLRCNGRCRFKGKKRL